MFNFTLKLLDTLLNRTNSSLSYWLSKSQWFFFVCVCYPRGGWGLFIELNPSLYEFPGPILLEFYNYYEQKILYLDYMEIYNTIS